VRSSRGYKTSFTSHLLAAHVAKSPPYTIARGKTKYKRTNGRNTICCNQLQVILKQPQAKIGSQIDKLSADMGDVDAYPKAYRSKYGKEK
jgi:hypothetical protein